MRAGILFIAALFFGVWFTVLTATAWKQRRRLTAAFLGLLAAVDLAVAFDALMR